ncbi:MAG: acyl-CoA thioester hydrolase [Muribaculum sp.]|nr:acyl-CoA thioester hydrolase [Muribaculum sp.]
MEKIHFSTETDGFYGTYWKCREGRDAAIILMLGDDPDDYMARNGVKWLHKLGVHVMSMSPAKKDYGHHNYPLERIETAIKWLKNQGMGRIGIVGASTTGTLALTAASYFEDITLTIGITPSDFIWQGFMQGKRDGCKEWPIEGESLFSYKGRPLPYMPFVYKHPDYWRVIAAESKRTGDMINSWKLFDDSEKAHPHTEDEMIRVEKIKGRLLLIGASDDALWDTVKYIGRMEERLKSRPHECKVEIAVYEHGTHFIFPESMLRTMLPVFSEAFVKMAFQAAKKYPEECKETRMDVDRKVRKVITEWSLPI